MINNSEKTQNLTITATNILETTTIETKKVPVTESIASEAKTTGLNTTAEHGKIAYFSNRYGYYDIYVMNADGSGIVCLTDNDKNDFGPCFSPDGRTIAYSSNLDGDYDIYLMNADGTGILKLTDDEVYEWYPCFSYDGKSIIFTSGRDWDPEIFIMNIDGTSILKITDNDVNDYSGSWISY